MFSTRPLAVAARIGAAVGASLALVIGSLPGAAEAAPRSAQPGYVDPEVSRTAAADPNGTVRVIITRDRGGDPRKAVRDWGGNVLNELNLAKATVAEVPASRIADIARERGVARIAYDAPVHLQSLDPLALGASQLQTVYPLAVDAASQWNGGLRLRGTGVGVAVIDSGIASTNQDFLGGSLTSSNRVLALLNGISNSSLSGGDDNGHGTFVAGIIGGRGVGVPGVVAPGSYFGIAPDANLISVKVSDSRGMAYVSDVIAAIEWVAQHRHDYNIRVLNLSLVSSLADSYLTDMLDAAVELAWLQGIVVVVAAGNAGPNAPITSPANDPFVITVGATDDRGTAATSDDVLASFSSYGQTVDGKSKPDMVAPGRHIVSVLASPTAPLALEFPNRVLGNGSYIQLSGTSAAAPVVTGVIAQLLQARPSLTPGQVKWLLTHTALPVSGPGTGAGYPRVGAAVSFPGTPGTTDHQIPNRYLLAAYLANLHKNSTLTAASSVSWDSVSWDSVSWDSVSWDSVSWDSVSWDSVSWDSVAFLPAD